MRIKIGKLSFDVDENVAEAYAAERDDWQGLVESAEKEAGELREKLDAATARADAAEVDRDKEKARADAAEDSDKLGEAVKARLSLERAASKYLKEDVSEKSDAEIMRAVILKDAPAAKLDDASDVYLRTRFDHVMDRAAADTSNVDNFRHVVKDAPGDTFDESAALDKLHERTRDAWKDGLQ